MHKGVTICEEHNKRCDTCDSKNSWPKDYPCYKCIRNTVEHQEDSYDMWRPWTFYSNSGGCCANGGQ